MTTRLAQRWLLVLLFASLLACSSEDDPPLSREQVYYFTESLRQIEDGGRQLRSANLDEAGLNAALDSLDQGLRLAFQVERAGLDRLDQGLGRYYQRYFIGGVENYRLGIEAGDEAQQREGLKLLAQWAEFWAAERDAILERLQPD